METETLCDGPNDGEECTKEQHLRESGVDLATWRPLQLTSAKLRTAAAMKSCLQAMACGVWRRGVEWTSLASPAPYVLMYPPRQQLRPEQTAPPRADRESNDSSNLLFLLLAECLANPVDRLRIKNSSWNTNVSKAPEPFNINLSKNKWNVKLKYSEKCLIAGF